MSLVWQAAVVQDKQIEKGPFEGGPGGEEHSSLLPCVLLLSSKFAPQT